MCYAQSSPVWWGACVRTWDACEIWGVDIVHLINRNRWVYTTRQDCHIHCIHELVTQCQWDCPEHIGNQHRHMSSQRNLDNRRARPDASRCDAVPSASTTAMSSTLQELESETLAYDRSRVKVDFASVDNLGGRRWVWHRVGEGYADGWVMERNPWCGLSMMTWGGTGINQGVGPVIFQNLAMEIASMHSSILTSAYMPNRPFFLPQKHHFAARQHPHTQGHAELPAPQYPHHALTVPQPTSRSHRVSWDELYRRLNQVRPRPATPTDLRQAIFHTWANISRATVNRLVHSMPQSCRAVINANAGHTQYWMY